MSFKKGAIGDECFLCGLTQGYIGRVSKATQLRPWGTVSHHKAITDEDTEDVMCAAVQ
jgi:hypothetical protein